MPNTPKSSRRRARSGDAPNHKSSYNAYTGKADFTDVVTPLYLNTLTRAAEFQKNALSLAAQQSAEWISAWKGAMSHFPMSPPGLFFDLAQQTVQSSVETQKGAIDLVVEQTEAITEIAQERAREYSKIAENASSAFQATVMRSVEAQKRVLESASEQNKAMFAATRREVGDGPGGVLVDSFERGTDTMLRAQKSILDATAQPFMAKEE